MEPNPEKLDCLSIILCDQVYRDEVTKKLIIVGTFNRIYAKEIPCRHSSLSVLFSLTNGKGKYNLSLSVEHAETGHEVAAISGPFEMPDPLAIVEINMAFEDLVFPYDGKYWIVLKADQEIIQQRPFTIARTQAQQDKD